MVKLRVPLPLRRVVVFRARCKYYDGISGGRREQAGRAAEGDAAYGLGRRWWRTAGRRLRADAARKRRHRCDTRRPPPAQVLVKSPDARRRSEIATLARSIEGLHAVEVQTTHEALDVLREAPKPPVVALVDAYDENDDGELDQDEMSWPLLRTIQRPCKPYRDDIRQTSSSSAL